MEDGWWTREAGDERSMAPPIGRGRLWTREAIYARRFNGYPLDVRVLTPHKLDMRLMNIPVHQLLQAQRRSERSYVDNSGGLCIKEILDEKQRGLAVSLGFGPVDLALSLGLRLDQLAVLSPQKNCGPH